MSYFHFQEESNALKYILFGYCKLWIFEVWSIASPRMQVQAVLNL